MPATLLSQSSDRSPQSGRHPGLISLASHFLWLLLAVLIAATVMAAPAHSAVSVRVDARPIGQPIKASVTVTDANGAPVTGLTAASFSVSVDGLAVAAPGFSLPPVQTSGQKVSVVFAMDYSSSVQSTVLAPMQEAIKTFINSMQPGDYAAIVKFNTTLGASVVKEFTQVDGAANTAALIDAVYAAYPGSGSNVFDAVVLSTQHLAAPPITLPSGPKAVVLISDGVDNSSSADINSVVKAANDAKIAVFTIGIGNFTSASSQQILTGLADQTGAEFYPAPKVSEISDAYLQVSELLNNGYLLTFDSTITDCGTHTLGVQVTGQAAVTEPFTRCTPLLAPDLRGLTEADAKIELNKFALAVGPISTEANYAVSAGSVVRQEPAAGTVVQPGSAVSLVISSGPPTASRESSGGGATGPVELLAGLLLLAALRRWRAAGER